MGASAVSRCRGRDTLYREDQAQRNDFKWAHVELNGSLVVDEHRRGTLGRLFQQTNPLDLLHRTWEMKCGAPAIAVRLVETEDEPFPVFGPFEAAERERQTVHVEEVIDPSLASVAGSWDRDQRRVQRERFADDVALGPVSGMWEKAVGEGMATFVRIRVGVERAA